MRVWDRAQLRLASLAGQWLSAPSEQNLPLAAVRAASRLMWQGSFGAAPSSCLSRPPWSWTPSPELLSFPSKVFRSCRGPGGPNFFFPGRRTLGWSPAGRITLFSVICR